MNEMLNWSSNSGGTLLFVVVLLEQAGLPIPAAPCLLAAGAFCVAGESSPAQVIGTTLLACLIADLAWYYLGRRSGKRILQFLGRVALAGPQSAEQVEQRFLRHGLPVLAVAKFVPGLSVAAPPLAGALGIGLSDFLLFDSLGAVLYAGFYLGLGSLFSEEVQALLQILDHVGLCSVLVFLVVIMAVLALRHLPRSRGA